MEGGHYAKIGGMCTLKHDTRLPKFYKLLIKTKLKGNNELDLRNLYNHINMCLNAVNRILEDLLPDYHYIKRHSDFEEEFILDRDHLSYSCNAHTYTSLGHSILVSTANYAYAKYSMTPQAYKVINTHAHEISGRTIILRLIHFRNPRLGGMNGEVQS